MKETGPNIKMAFLFDLGVAGFFWSFGWVDLEFS